MITREYASSLLSYNKRTGDLTWKPRPRSMFPSDWAFKVWNKRFAGAVAGGIHQANQHLIVGINGTRYQAARLIWLIVKGEPVPYHIDHKDRNGLNNRWSNLRAATKSQNSANAKVRIDNTSGAKGVGLYRNGKFYARIKANKVFYHLGFFNTFEEAVAARRFAEQRLLGKFS